MYSCCFFHPKTIDTETWEGVGWVERENFSLIAGVNQLQRTKVDQKKSDNCIKIIFLIYNSIHFIAALLTSENPVWSLVVCNFYM